MRVFVLRALWQCSLTVFLGGCSPYVYKTEINGFASGVDALASAYASGLKSTTSERLERQRWQWGTSRARLALTPGCVPQPGGTTDAAASCALQEVGKIPSAPSKTEQQAGAAVPIVRALREYANGLAAVANAEDQQVLEAAQMQFRNAVQDLVKQQDPKLAASLGPAADLFWALTTAALNARRYEILRSGVTVAQDPVTQLGRAMGDTLDAIRTARANELRLTADFLTAELGPGVDRAEYVSRLTLIETKVNALETLRRSDPRQAVRVMVAAHETLKRALNDDARQAEAVVASVRLFMDKARAARDALGN